MTLAENEPSSLAAADHQRHSRMQPGSRSGPNKEGATAPDGASALGNELGGEQDAQKERQNAIRQGDQLPPLDQSNDGSAGSLGFGQLNGFEKGFGQGPSKDQREKNQQEKNQAWNSNDKDLGAIARNSAGTANFNPTQDPDSIVSTGNRRPEEILDTAARSIGTESGVGAYSGGIVNQAETNKVPDQ